MSGFGHDPFGEFPFGEAWFAEACWRFVPSGDRFLDESVGHPMRRFVRSVTDLFDDARRLTSGMQFHRDALKVRTRRTGRVELMGLTYAFFEAEEALDGRSYVTCSVDPDLLVGVSLDWTLDDGSTFYALRSLSKVDGELSFYTDAVPSVTTLILSPRSLLDLLGQDFGVEVDGYEPDVYQRSSVNDRHKLIDLRGAKTAIEFRAILAGFTATVYHLWRLAPGLETVYTGETWEIPDGSGQFFASEGVLDVHADTMVADLIPMDEPNPGGRRLIFDGAISVVSGSAGAWVVTISVFGPPDLTFLQGGRWYFRDEAGTVKFFVDPEDVNVADGQVTVRTQTAPIPGDAGWYYWPKVDSGSDWAVPTHVLRVELDIADPRLLEDARALIAAYDRMVKKIETILPAHVKIGQYVFDILPDPAIMLVDADAVVESLTFTELFDETEADVIPTDVHVIVEH